MSRTQEYETFTITHIGENSFGNVYAVYSKLLCIVFADICKDSKESEYELRIYSRYALTLYAMKSISEFIELISTEAK